MSRILNPASFAIVRAISERRACGGFVLGNLLRCGWPGAMHLVSRSGTERRRRLSVAKALVGPLARRCGLDAIQMHGAMVMTDECRNGHPAKRLITDGLLFGDASHPLAQFPAARRPAADPAQPTYH